MAGSSGSFGGAGCAAAGGTAALEATGEPFRAGAFASLVDALAGSPGLTGVALIFAADLSGFSRLPELGMKAFALALVATGAASAREAATLSDFGWGLTAIFAESKGFFATGCASGLAGAAGMIEAILSFSTSTYPKSVLTLNMFSSYATITP